MAGWSEGGWKNGRLRGVAGKSVQQGGMEEAPENGKESLHSVHSNGLIDWLINYQNSAQQINFITVYNSNGLLILFL